MDEAVPQKFELKQIPQRVETKAKELIASGRRWTGAGKQWLKTLGEKSDTSPREVVQEIADVPAKEDELVEKSDSVKRTPQKTSLDEVLKNNRDSDSTTSDLAMSSYDKGPIRVEKVAESDETALRDEDRRKIDTESLAGDSPLRPLESWKQPQQTELTINEQLNSGTIGRFADVYTVLQQELLPQKDRVVLKTLSPRAPYDESFDQLTEEIVSRIALGETGGKYVAPILSIGSLEGNRYVAFQGEDLVRYLKDVRAGRERLALAIRDVSGSNGYANLDGILGVASGSDLEQAFFDFWQPILLTSTFQETLDKLGRVYLLSRVALARSEEICFQSGFLKTDKPGEEVLINTREIEENNVGIQRIDFAYHLAGDNNIRAMLNGAQVSSPFENLTDSNNFQIGPNTLLNLDSDASAGFIRDSVEKHLSSGSVPKSLGEFFAQMLLARENAKTYTVMEVETLINDLLASSDNTQKFIPKKSVVYNKYLEKKLAKEV